VDQRLLGRQAVGGLLPDRGLFAGFAAGQLVPGRPRWVPDLRVEPSWPAAPERRPYALR
jgi:hypothetical protein